MKSYFWTFAVISLIVSVIAAFSCFDHGKLDACMYLTIYAVIDTITIFIKLCCYLDWKDDGNGFNPFID